MSGFVPPVFEIADADTVGWPMESAFEAVRVLPHGQAPELVHEWLEPAVNCHSQAANADVDSVSATAARAACPAAVLFVFIVYPRFPRCPLNTASVVPVPY